MAELKDDFVRLSQIVKIMNKHGFASLIRRIPILSRFSKSAKQQSNALPVEMRFTNMLEDLGPTFVKLGQILSTRSDLLPQTFTEALSRLQDQVPPFPFAQVKEQIEEEFGAPLADLFDTFDTEPLASASMAQVHTAELDGQQLVVKVLRPNIEEKVWADSSVLHLLAKVLELLVEEASHYHIRDLVEEFEKGLKGELDFHLEAQNLQRFSRLNAGREHVHIPFLLEERSGKRVMTMERIFGVRITDLLEKPGEAPILHPSGRSIEEIVEGLVHVGYENFFVDGMFHADPHPGNILVTETGDVAFIDFGLMGRVYPDTQNRVLLVLVAMSLRDSSSLASLLMRIGEADRRIELPAFRDAITRLLDTYLGLDVADMNSSTIFADLLELSMDFGLRMPKEFALLSRAAVAVEGIVRILHPRLNPGKQFVTRSHELLKERLDPRELGGGGLRSALQIGILLQDLPLQLSQNLIDLERGTMQVRITSDELSKLERDIRGLGMTISSGLIAAVLVLVGLQGLSEYKFELWGVPLLPIFCFLGATLLYLVAFTWFLTNGKIPQLSMRSAFQFFLGRQLGESDRRKKKRTD